MEKNLTRSCPHFGPSRRRCMIKLVEIIKDNAELRMLKQCGSKAKRMASELLAKRGLENPEYFILRIKEASKIQNWVALYRTHSVMSGRPIFGINSHLPEIARRYDPNINLIT